MSSQNKTFRTASVRVSYLFFIMIAPHTLSNFQSLTKLITLIINRFYSHCRGDWQIALTKPNFSDRLFFYPLIQNSKFFSVPPNSKFRIHNSLCRPHSHPSHYSHSSHNCPCSSHPIIPIAPTIAPHK